MQVRLNNVHSSTRLLPKRPREEVMTIEISAWPDDAEGIQTLILSSSRGVFMLLRPEPTASLPPWVCEACTLENPAIADECEACQASRSERPPPLADKLLRCRLYRQSKQEPKVLVGEVLVPVRRLADAADGTLGPLPPLPLSHPDARVLKSLVRRKATMMLLSEVASAACEEVAALEKKGAGSAKDSEVPRRLSFLPSPNKSSSSSSPSSSSSFSSSPTKAFSSPAKPAIVKLRELGQRRNSETRLRALGKDLEGVQQHLEEQRQGFQDEFKQIYEMLAATGTARRASTDSTGSGATSTTDRGGAVAAGLDPVAATAPSNVSDSGRVPAMLAIGATAAASYVSPDKVNKAPTR